MSIKNFTLYLGSYTYNLYEASTQALPEQRQRQVHLHQYRLLQVYLLVNESSAIASIKKVIIIIIRATIIII